MVEVIDRIFQIMKANLPRDKQIQEYVVGKPNYDDIRRDPYMYGIKPRSNYDGRGKGHDYATFTVEITVGKKRTKKLGPTQKKGENAAYRELYELIETADFTQPQAAISTDCIVGILRKFVTLRGDTRDTSNEIAYNIEVSRIEYDDNVEQGTFVEATITIDVEMILLVNNRQ